MDPTLLRLVNDQDAAVDKELDKYYSDIERLLGLHRRGDDLNDTQTLFDKLAKAAFIMGVSLATVYVTYNALAARRSVNKDNERLKRVFLYHGANREATRFLDQQRDRIAKQTADTVLNRRWPGTNKSFDDRIKTIRNGSERVVRNIINLGIKDGKSSWVIAKEIEAYVKPNENGLRVAPWTITRRELGKPVSYIPTGVPAGSVEYNAHRIARTELALTYQQAPYIAHKDKWYYNGTLWVLSRSHPKIDRCDDYAAHDEGIGIGYWRKPPATPHPHCLCHTEVRTVSTDEMIKMFKLLNWST